VSDPLSSIFNLIISLVGQPSTGGAIPFFDPLYNLTVLVWMGAIAAIIVSPFSKRFRGFAAFLTWIALFLTFVARGSSSQGEQISTLSTLFSISSSLVFLLVFVILSVWLFGRLLGRKKIISTPSVSK
jgi:lipopolysaccharide export LptBFGC system permease protein LptF